MPSDYQLLYEYLRDYKHETQASASKFLAERHGLSEDSIRGRLSRANTLENRVQVGKDLLELKNTNPSIMRQEQVIQESQLKWNSLRDEWNHLNRPVVGYFISDKHIGQKTRHDYWLLTLKILEREPHVDVYSALNDWQDNEGWGRHDDTRSPKEKVWSSDIQNCFDVEDNDYKLIHDITGASAVAINGNHDLWWYRYIRAHSVQSAELQIADRMETLFDLNIMMFNRMTHENHVDLSKGLVWRHGGTTAKRASSRARNVLSKHMTPYGQARSVVIGHTHRPILLKGEEVDFKGVWFANAGTFMQTHNVPYLNDGIGEGWRGGIVRCEFTPDKLHHTVSLIEFRDVDSYAVAYQNGTEIMRVPIE